MVRIGIIREGKVPQDARVPLTPRQAAGLAALPDVDLVVQPSPHRCFTDAEYAAEGLTLAEDLSDRDVLLGVKEVPVDALLAGKTYFFFSHTIKKQPYNRGLLRTILERGIRLVDWETLTDGQGRRLIAFGRWAGIVGAHNALWTWGLRSGAYTLPRAIERPDFEALKAVYAGLDWPPVKIAVTGGGRVAQGALETLQAAGIRAVDPETFRATERFDEAVYVQLDCPDFYARRDGAPFDWADFFARPGDYRGTFAPWAAAADVMINAIYWDPAAPVFFTREQMAAPDFRLRAIADITCDIDGSVPSTVRATTIADPVYGWDLDAGAETEALTGERVLTVMSIDNLPNELPRDASTAFGEQFLEAVWPALREGVEHPVIARATIAREGGLGGPYAYLADYVADR